MSGIFLGVGGSGDSLNVNDDVPGVMVALCVGIQRLPL